MEIPFLKKPLFVEIQSCTPKQVEYNFPAKFSSMLNNDSIVMISCKIPDWFNTNMNLCGYFENFTIFTYKVSPKINLLAVQDYHLSGYNDFLASKNCVEVVPSVLETSEISNNYHIYHSALY